MLWLLLPVALLLAVPFHLALSSGLAPAEQLALLFGRPAEAWEEVLFMHAALPRAIMAVLAGAGLGLAGSVLQQVTRNRLVSPLTVGASSGAWLALVTGAVVAPSLAADHGIWFAMGGSALATGLVLLIAGPRGIGGLPVVLAGMAMNILLGAVATVMVLLNDQKVRGLFVWGSGDLTQTDWSWIVWLAPQLAIATALVLLCSRPLTLMRLGLEGAAGRGLAVAPFVVVAVLLALWASSAVITAVGVIGFIGLLAPNIARLVGARSVLAELVASLLLGAVVLLLTDALAVAATAWSRDLVPSGASAALIGLPALIWLALRRMRTQDHAVFELPKGRARVTSGAAISVAAGLAALVVIVLTVGPTTEGWRLAWPSELVFSLRWPRVLTAAAAGVGMAISGVILQRLLRNPLASPDIIGISSGASLALVVAVVAFGSSIASAGAPVALLGALAVLAVLIVLGHRHNNAPNVVALVGISLAALTEAALQFVLAKGGVETYMVLGWLAGSTYRASEAQAVGLALGVVALGGLCLALHRWLTLLSAGDAVAGGRGLSVPGAKAATLCLGAVAAAAVTAVVGPIAFVGLLAPHVAVMLGARTVRPQLVLASGVGAGLMILSDWAGRSLLYPDQIPAGTTAAIVGGTWFALLLAGRRIRPGEALPGAVAAVRAWARR